jgi:chromosomal replication initiation ATPase DnaA
MTKGQLPLDLPARSAMGAADFVTAPSNAAAMTLIEAWPHWPEPGRALAVHGPAECGKTHLGHVFQERAMAAGRAVLYLTAPRELPDLPPDPVIILDAPELDETDFFHLLNRLKNEGGDLLILAREAPARWPVKLPDLASRLKALPAVEVATPDDALLGAVLAKHFVDRQIAVAPEVIDYLLRQMERSFAAAAEIAARLDQAALAEGRAITVPLAKKTLGGSAHPPEPTPEDTV